MLTIRLRTRLVELSSLHVGRKVKSYYMCFTTLKNKTEIGEIITYNDQNKD